MNSPLFFGKKKKQKNGEKKKRWNIKTRLMFFLQHYTFRKKQTIKIVEDSVEKITTIVTIIPTNRLGLYVRSQKHSNFSYISVLSPFLLDSFWKKKSRIFMFFLKKCSYFFFFFKFTFSPPPLFSCFCFSSFSYVFFYTFFFYFFMFFISFIFFSLLSLRYIFAENESKIVGKLLLQKRRFPIWKFDEDISI